MLTKNDFLEEFNEEIPATRKMLERVPFDKVDFKPTPKSMDLGTLAYVVSGMPDWFVGIIKDGSIELASYKMPAKPTNVAELLALFDKGVEHAQKALVEMDEKTLNDPWQLKMKDKVLMEEPRYKVLRQTINHIVHHRAQLGVYLKMNGVPHPAVYGASGDEP